MVGRGPDDLRTYQRLLDRTATVAPVLLFQGGFDPSAKIDIGP